MAPFLGWTVAARLLVFVPGSCRHHYTDAPVPERPSEIGPTPMAGSNRSSVRAEAATSVSRQAHVVLKRLDPPPAGASRGRGGGFLRRACFLHGAEFADAPRPGCSQHLGRPAQRTRSDPGGLKAPRDVVSARDRNSTSVLLTA